MTSLFLKLTKIEKKTDLYIILYQNTSKKKQKRECDLEKAQGSEDHGA